MSKKVVYATLLLAIGLCSCTNDETGNDTGYVDVVIGSKSETLTKSIVSPGGTTSWDVNDRVYIVDTDGKPQEFRYNEEGAMSSARFKGTLKKGQGESVYVAFYAGNQSTIRCKDQQYLTVERGMNIEINEGGVSYNSALLGEYCPMVTKPLKFDVESEDDDMKIFHFYHLTCMIEGRVSITNNNYLNKSIDQVVFELRALDSTPFNKQITIDMDLLKEIQLVQYLNECFVSSDDESLKTDFMSTTFNFESEYTIKQLIEEYEGYFPIPIFALPTEDAFNYLATIKFYNDGVLQMQMEGDGEATKLNPIGLNILNFGNSKIVAIE